MLSSHLNEPLRAQIDLQLNAGDVLEDSCLSLATADGGGMSQLGNIPLRDIHLNFNSSAKQIILSSRQSFTEPFAIFQIKINCLQSGHLAKNYTLLPEIAHESVPLSVQNPIITLPVVSVASAPVITNTPTADAAIQAVVPYRRPAKAKKIAVLHINEEPPPFALKLSSEPLDLTRQPILSAETRAWLAVQHALLNEEAPGSYLLNLQLQLAQAQQALALSKQTTNTAALPPPNVPFTATLIKIGLKFLDTWKYALLLFALGLAAWLGYRLLKQRQAKQWNHRDDSPALTSAYSQITPKNTVAHAPEVPEKSPAEQQLAGKEDQEIAVLEEGELYAIYGHSDKGVKILLEYLGAHPNSEKVWLRLLSIYASQGLASEFEKTAKEFLVLNKNSKLWRMMQALGRTVDQHNPLYADESTQPLFPLNQEEKQIGDILVEMGYISVADLQLCLAEYDFNKHGRFGHFLVMHRLITHSQLDEALYKQQSTPRHSQSRADSIVGDETVKLNIELPPLSPTQSSVKKELFEYDWDFTQQNKP